MLRLHSRTIVLGDWSLGLKARSIMFNKLDLSGRESDTPSLLNRVLCGRFRSSSYFQVTTGLLFSKQIPFACFPGILSF